MSASSRQSRMPPSRNEERPAATRRVLLRLFQPGQDAGRVQRKQGERRQGDEAVDRHVPIEDQDENGLSTEPYVPLDFSDE